MGKISLSGLQRALTQLVTWAKGLFATKDGYYSEMNVGAADKINGANAIPVSDAFRGYVGESGSAFIRSIKGKSVVWNQQIVDADRSGSDTHTGGSTYLIKSLSTNGYIAKGHKMLIKGRASLSILPVQFIVQIDNYSAVSLPGSSITADEMFDFAAIANVNTDAWHEVRLYCSGLTAQDGCVMTWENVAMFDLTLMFGAGNEPATVEEFEAMFPMPYYDYNEGEIISNSASGLKIVGFNQWDEEWEAGSFNWNNGVEVASTTTIRSKNYIPVFPGASYYFCKTKGSVSGSNLRVCFYDANKTFVSANTWFAANAVKVVPDNCHYMRFTSAYDGATYNHDICINLSDPARNGEYEPYKTNTIELNLTTLTGKLNGEGESVVIASEGLKSAGSVYDEAIVEDGFITKIIKRVGTVDLGTLNWDRYAYNTDQFYYFRTVVSGGLPANGAYVAPNIVCDKYTNSATANTPSLADKNITNYGPTVGVLLVRDDYYSDAATFKTAMSGVMLFYELAEPITYVLDEPIAAVYSIENGGTESVIAEDSEGRDAALFLRDTAYPQPSDLNMASLLPDFDHLTPVEVIEYNVARNGFCLLYNRANPSGTKASDVTDVVAFRLTVTGADMPEKQVISVMVMLSGRQNTYANGFLNANTPDVSAAGKYGIYQLRQYAPKVLGSGYGWGMEFNTYTANERHIKVEVFKKTSAIEFYKAQTASAVNSTNYIFVATNVDTFRPLMSLAANIAGSATSAAYVNGYMPAFTGTAVFVAGEALTTNDLAFMSTDGKSYKIGTKNKPIRPEAGIIVIGTNFNANAGMGYAYTRKITSGTAFTSISAERDTFAVNDEVFLRCTMVNGELYSDGYLSNTMSAGYTWISVGIAYAATAMCINTMGKEFLTLDANGKLTHVNGREIVQSTVPTDMVKYTAQTLTDEQKTQARTNIGAGTYSKPSGGIPASDIASGVIPAAPVNADWNASSGLAQILNKPTIPAAPVNADWNASSGLAQILNKPTVPTTYAGSPTAGGFANKTVAIPFGSVDSDSTATDIKATVDNFPTTLIDGVCAYIRNDVVASASGFTLNINGTGAKPVYQTLSDATRVTTVFSAAVTYLFIYNSTRVDGGCWDIYYGYNANDNTIGYNLRTNSMSLPTTSACYRYRLLFTSADGTHFVPANASTSTNATAKRTTTQTPIDPFGSIRYYSYTTAVSSGSRPGPTYLWEQYVITLGYSFNRTGATLALTAWKPVYIKCTPQEDGSAIIDAETPYVQDLPTTADGEIYIFLGVATEATKVEVVFHHPVYYHDGTCVRLWTGIGIDSTPTQNSKNLVTSGGIYDAIQNAGGGGGTIPELKRYTNGLNSNAYFVLSEVEQAVANDTFFIYTEDSLFGKTTESRVMRVGEMFTINFFASVTLGTNNDISMSQFYVTYNTQTLVPLSLIYQGNAYNYNSSNQRFEYTAPTS